MLIVPLMALGQIALRHIVQPLAPHLAWQGVPCACDDIAGGGVVFGCLRHQT